MDNKRKTEMQTTQTTSRAAAEAQRRRDSKWAQACVNKLLARAFEDASEFWELAFWLGLA